MNSIDYCLSDEEKIKAFDMIADNYYSQNFGSISKTDLDLIIFSIFINHCENANIPSDDYSLSKVLGITQNRIRALKERRELKYPSKGDEWWKEKFVEGIKYAKYDDVKHLIKMSITDVNVMIELRNFVEKNNWYDEYQLNPKLFQCRLDIFIQLCSQFEGTFELDEDTKLKILELSKLTNDEKDKSALVDFTKETFRDGLKLFVLNASKEVLKELLKLIPFGGLAGVAIDALVGLI